VRFIFTPAISGKEENLSPVASWRDRGIEEQDRSGSDPASLVRWMIKDGESVSRRLANRRKERADEEVIGPLVGSVGAQRGD
jgi:hypothetical protein